MQRRKFVEAAGSCALTLAWLPAFSLSAKSYATTEVTTKLIDQLISLTDSRIDYRLETQITDPNNRWYGGSPNLYGIPNASSSCALISDLSCAFCSPQSKYFKSEALMDSIELATRYLLAIQYPDGTVDLHTTNFHSPPDTAFRVEPLALSYQILSTQAEHAAQALQHLQQFLINAGKALSIGGIHTPNHRWVVCMALAHIHNLFPDQAYAKRIDQWLAEGIDIDPDGQFTEKSTTVYSPLVDRCLITVARLMDKPELLDPVRKNLEMTLYYLRPNFQVSTETSGRQDQYQIGTVAPYYYPYRYMALLDNNHRFAYVIDHIENKELNRISNQLPYFLTDQFLNQQLPEKELFNTDYVKYFKNSDLVRIRRGNRDASILANNPLIFSYFKGNAALTGLRLASAFFGKGQFVGQEIEIKDSEYTLRQSLTGPYYQPLESGGFEGTQQEFAEQRKTRDQSEVQELETVIRIAERENGFAIGIQISGTENVPVALELGFRAGGELNGVTSVTDIEGAYLLTGERLEFKYEGQTINVAPGHVEHRWTQLRGALPKMEGDSVYLTGYTPLDWELMIT